MKTKKITSQSITFYFKRILKIDDSRYTSKLILNPIYQNDDDRQLFI